VRIVLGRRVQFGNQIRTTPVHVHPRCVAEVLRAEDCATESAGLIQTLRETGRDLPADRLEIALARIGELS